MIDPHDYIAEQLSTILGTPVQPSSPVVKRAWSFLSREEERGAEKDRHGNFPHKQSLLCRLGLLEHPPLHADIAMLAHEYAVGEARWPKGHRFAACLTHDVDRIVSLPWRERFRQLYVLADRVSLRQAARWLASGSLSALQTALGYSNPAPFDAWVEEEARFGFHSTFFVLPELLAMPTLYDHYYRYTDRVRYQGRRMRFSDAARRLDEAGWEIGLHGSYASALDGRIYGAEKVHLEEMLGTPVISTRQHFLRYDPEKTPGIHHRAGIQADSTIGYSTTIGCRSGIAFPYFAPAEGDVLEVPLCIQDVGLLRIQGRNLNLDTAISRARAFIQRIANAGGVVTLSWHTHPESPGAYPCYRALLETIAELGGWGCSLGELNAWWRARRAQVRELRATYASAIGSTTLLSTEPRRSRREKQTG
ncbi:MAG: DUF7033 domain-containing protein [Armatimonadota bacterium]